MSPRNTCHAGWSLLELLMVLGLMGLCASLAWPSYQALMQRSQRAQARVLLLQTAHWLERSAAVQGSDSLTGCQGEAVARDGRYRKVWRGFWRFPHATP